MSERHIHIWAENGEPLKQYDLLPEEARDLERDGVIHPDRGVPAGRYHFDDQFLAETSLAHTCVVDAGVWDALERRIANLGYRGYE